MGCVGSKQTVLVTPAVDHSGAFGDHGAGTSSASGRRRRIDAEEIEKKRAEPRASRTELGRSAVLGSSNRPDPVSFRLANLHRHVEGEQVAAGWPAWLSAVAMEAIQGWVPLKAESFQKLEKIGQGTYSSVFRARSIETGKIAALKKVRFDNFEPESVRFMAREISILRRLEHPNIIRLEGIVTSRFSCSIYLVFEYMEHDLTGLLACADVKFTESQVKCYMKQLLSGVEHCHSHNLMHRDIKGANLLINNEGILKIADFGLANFFCGHPLTSRVVTLWYRPPELLLGSTEYESSVDLWSVGCVFAEILLGKPILQGRTEVEQLHKIFKLCGSPPDEYWRTTRLPHTTLFKPHHTYEANLPDTCRGLPETAVSLLSTLLSVEPHKRDTAASALASEYFRTKPHACAPSSLPKYPPSKEIDAKKHEEAAKRKKPHRRNRPPDDTSRASKNPNKDLLSGIGAVNGDMRCGRIERHSKDEMGEVPFSGPMQLSSSSGFSWARKPQSSSSVSRVRVSHAEAGNNRRNNVADNPDTSSSLRIDGLDRRPPSRRTDTERPDSFDGCELYDALQVTRASSKGDRHNREDDDDDDNKVEFSGPLLMQTHKVDQFLERHERHVRRAVRNSWFRRGKKTSSEE